MFERLIADLETLGDTEMRIVASGEYPTKRRTKVADVAVYQNDGTETITPSRFVQRAANRKRGWASPLFHAVGRFLFHGADMQYALKDVGIKASYDIAAACDRVRTGRLKKSFVPEITKS